MHASPEESPPVWTTKAQNGRRAYGLAPNGAGFTVADLSCRPERRPDIDGVYRSTAIGAVVSGEFEYRSQSQRGVAVPGSVILANAGEWFHCEHLTGRGNRRLVVFFDDGLFAEIAGERNPGAPQFERTLVPPSRFTSLLSGLLCQLTFRHHPCEETAIAVADLSLGMSSARRQSAEVPVADRRRILEAVRHINARYAEPCTLDDLAAAAGMSRYHFARRFHAAIGATSNQYLNHRRLTAAAALLSSTSAPVSQIAFDVGFRDLSYFHQRFKVVFGKSPGRWRRSN